MTLLPEFECWLAEERLRGLQTLRIPGLQPGQQTIIDLTCKGAVDISPASLSEVTQRAILSAEQIICVRDRGVSQSAH